MPDSPFMDRESRRGVNAEPTEAPRNSEVLPVPWRSQHVAASFLGTRGLKPQSVHAVAECSPAGLTECVDPVSRVGFAPWDRRLPKHPSFCCFKSLQGVLALPASDAAGMPTGRQKAIRNPAA